MSNEPKCDVCGFAHETQKDAGMLLCVASVLGHARTELAYLRDLVLALAPRCAEGGCTRPALWSSPRSLDGFGTNVCDEHRDDPTWPKDWVKPEARALRHAAALRRVLESV